MIETKTQTAAPVAPPIEELDKTLTAMDTFMAPTNEVLDEADYANDKENLVGIKQRLGENIIENDAINNIAKGVALHRMLTGVNANEAKNKIDVDVQGMHAKILSHATWTEEQKAKYGRAIQVLDTAKQNNLTIMKSDSGRYWFESNDTGEPVYAANGIVEVKELLDEFYDPTGEKDKEERKKQNVIDENEEITPDNAQRALSDSDIWMVRGLATDLVSSIGAIGMKLTGAGAVAGAGVGILGGLTAAGMTMYSDYLNDDVTAGEMWKNLGVRLGLEAIETVTVLPASAVSIFKGASRAGKVIRRGLQAAMIGGTINAATHADWDALWNKDMSDWGVEEYKSAAAMAQFLVGFGGASAMRSKAKGDLSKGIGDTSKPGRLQAKAKQELGLPSKTKSNTRADVTAEVQKNKQTLIAKTKKDVSDKAAPLEASTAKIGEARNAGISKTSKQKSLELGREARAKIKKINEAPNATTVNAETKQVSMDLDGGKSRAQADSKIDAINKKLKADRLALKNKTKSDLEKSTSATESRGKLIEKAKTSTEKQRVEKHAAKEKADVKELTNKKMAAAKEKLANDKQDVLDAHGEVIGNRLIGKGAKRSLGKDRGEKYVKRAQAETKQEKKQVNNVEKLKAEREALNKKAPEVRKTKAHKAKLIKKSEEIKAATERAKSYRGKADKMLAKAKEAKETGTGLGKKALAVGAAPVNFLVARNVLSPAVKSMHANEMFVSGRTPASLATVKSYLQSEGKGKEIAGKTESQLRAMAKKVAQDNKDKEKIEKKQIGGRMIRKAQAGLPFSWVLPAITNIVAGFSGPPNLYDKVNANSGRRDVRATENYTPPVTPTGPMSLGPNTVSTLEGHHPARQSDPGGNNLIDYNPDWFKKPGVQENIAKLMPKSQIAEDADPALIAIDAIIKEKDKKIQENPANKDEIEAEYDAKIAQAKQLATAKPNGWKTALGALSHIRVSDLMSTNKIHIERPNAEDLQSTVLHSRGIRNMHGFNAAKNKSGLIPRVDTADSFAANMMQKAYYNEGEKRKAELIGRNAQYVEKSRDEDAAIKNANITSAAATNNMNISRRNEAEREYAASLVQAKAQRDTLENQRKGRLADGLMKGLTEGYRKAQRTKLNTDYNSAVALKSRWNTEFKPRFDKAVAEGNDLDTKKVKSEFVEATQFNVDDLDKYMLDTKAKYDNIL